MLSKFFFLFVQYLFFLFFLCFNISISVPSHPLFSYSHSTSFFLNFPILLLILSFLFCHRYCWFCEYLPCTARTASYSHTSRTYRGVQDLVPWGNRCDVSRNIYDNFCYSCTVIIIYTAIL